MENIRMMTESSKMMTDEIHLANHSLMEQLRKLMDKLIEGSYGSALCLSGFAGYRSAALLVPGCEICFRRSTLVVRTLCMIIPFDQGSREVDKLGRRKYLVEKQMGSR